MISVALLALLILTSCQRDLQCGVVMFIIAIIESPTQILIYYWGNMVQIMGFKSLLKICRLHDDEIALWPSTTRDSLIVFLSQKFLLPSSMRAMFLIGASLASNNDAINN